MSMRSAQNIVRAGIFARDIFSFLIIYSCAQIVNRARPLARRILHNFSFIAALAHTLFSAHRDRIPHAPRPRLRRRPSFVLSLGRKKARPRPCRGKFPARRGDCLYPHALRRISPRMGVPHMRSAGDSGRVFVLFYLKKGPQKGPQNCDPFTVIPLCRRVTYSNALYIARTAFS